MLRRPPGQQLQELRDRQHLDPMPPQLGDQVQVTLDVVVARDGELGLPADGSFQQVVVVRVPAQAEIARRENLDGTIAQAVHDEGELVVAEAAASTDAWPVDDFADLLEQGPGCHRHEAIIQEGLEYFRGGAVRPDEGGDPDVRVYEDTEQRLSHRNGAGGLPSLGALLRGRP